MNDGRDDLARRARRSRRLPLSGSFLAESNGLPVRADEGLVSREPVAAEGRIPEGARDRVSKLAWQAVGARALDHEVATEARAPSRSAQEPGQERERHEREGEDDEPPDGRRRRAIREELDTTIAGRGRRASPAAMVDGERSAPQRRRGRAPAAEDTRSVAKSAGIPAARRRRARYGPPASPTISKAVGGHPVAVLGEVVEERREQRAGRERDVRDAQIA